MKPPCTGYAAVVKPPTQGPHAHALPSTPTRCSGCRGSFPSRAPKEGSQRGGQGLSPLSARGLGQAPSSPAAAQPSRKSQTSSPGREPSAGGGWYRGRLARLGAARAHGARPLGARQTGAFGLYFNRFHDRTTPLSTGTSPPYQKSPRRATNIFSCKAK